MLEFYLLKFTLFFFLKNIIFFAKIAERLHLPCLYLVDSGGAFLPLQSQLFADKNHGGRAFYNQATMSSLGIPQVRNTTSYTHTHTHAHTHTHTHTRTHFFTSFFHT